ncbi:bifunctional nicotinamidase/pyrazinamidase [Halocola ammonii]
MKTLLIVDVQNDFTPGGSLEVPNGDKVVPVINEIQSEYDLVIATQDWHPEDHKSFASNHKGKKQFEKIEWKGLEQILWPDHCVQGSRGSEFHPDLHTNRIEAIFRKGMDPDIDSYSGFYDNGHKKSTGLTGYLKEREVDELHICGLAGDVCVYFTLSDAISEGFKTTLIENGTRALDDKKFNEQINELKGKGLKVK